ncbi:MAG: AAA family ATPase [Clostridia bacterium]|jgi:cellulose biosynthesis protein BcsQ/DNA-binding NarL/FixJ family response regulator|nr:AAA family ATPase [Clostridia bacterium]
MRVLLATDHPALDKLLEKLESEAGIRDLEESLKEKGLSKWAQPITIVDEAKYKETVLEKARCSRPDVLLLYDKLPGAIELELLLEELRLESKNAAGQDTRIILLTSLEQGSTILRKAVEIGIWDIIAGKDIKPGEIIRRIYRPGNYSAVAHFKLASDTKSQVKYVPRYIEKEKIVEVEKEIKVTEIVCEKEYVRMGNSKGSKETLLFWSPYETGKTFLSVNLAVALADQGFKTVLIDTDCNNRSVQSFFAMDKEKRYGFLKSLKERSPADVVLERAYRYKKNLYVLPLPGGAAELPEADEEEFSLLYDGLRRACDIFVLDAAKDLHTPLTKTAFKLASRVILPVTPDANRLRGIRLKLQDLYHQGAALNKIEPVLNMEVRDGAPDKRELEEILELKMLETEIPAAPEIAYRSIAEGIPAYHLKAAPEHFVYSLDRLAAYIQGDEQAVRPKQRKLLNLF